MVLDKKTTFMTKLITPLMLMVILFTSFSCVVDSVGSQRAFEAGTSDIDDTDDFCQNYYEILDGDSPRCLPNRCETGTHEATTEEISDLLEQLVLNNFLDQDEKDDISGNINAAKKVCLDGSGILRPDQEIYIDGKNLCACKDGVPHILKNCGDICSSNQVSSNVVLYGQVSLSANVQINLGSLHSWCNDAIAGEDAPFNSPQCEIKFLEEDGTSNGYSVDITPGSNKFKATLVETVNFNYDTNYIVSIRETQSDVETTAEQIRFAEPAEDETIGPLKRVPVTRYQCLFMAASFSGTQTSFNDFALQHFYFIERNKPSAIFLNKDVIKCHDGFDEAGKENDDSLYPRMAETPVNFMLWDNTDTRMQGSSEAVESININITMSEELRRRLNRESDSTVNMNRFYPFTWEMRPDDSAEGPILTSTLGMIMSPYVDSNNQNRGICPGQDEYNSTNTEYNILGDYIQVDTEGIYMAQSDPYIAVNPIDGSIDQRIDVMLVKESDLKQVDFYEQNGQRFNPDESTIGSRTINFFFPFDFSGGHLIKKDSQTRYTVRFPDDIGRTEVDPSILQSGRPSDKRFACIPSL